MLDSQPFIWPVSSQEVPACSANARPPWGSLSSVDVLSALSDRKRHCHSAASGLASALPTEFAPALDSEDAAARLNSRQTTGDGTAGMGLASYPKTAMTASVHCCNVKASKSLVPASIYDACVATSMLLLCKPVRRSLHMHGSLEHLD